MQRPSIFAAVLCAVLLGGFVVEVVWMVGGTDLCPMAGAHATGVWLSGLAWFFCTDGLLWSSAVSLRGRRQPLRCCCSRKPGDPRYGLTEVRLAAAYYLALNLLQLGSTLCFGLVWRWDAFVWSAVLQSVLLVNAASSWQYAKSLAASVTAREKDGRSVVVEGGNDPDNELLREAAGGATDDDLDRLNQVLKLRSSCSRCCTCFRTAAGVIAAVLVVLLLNGAAFEAHGYATCVQKSSVPKAHAFRPRRRSRMIVIVTMMMVVVVMMMLVVMIRW